jgi:ParB/RepB/Spo0J family partition protein
MAAVPAESQLQVIQVPIDDLHPDTANPRKISASELDALTRSLCEWGFVQPVIARRNDHIVVGGHQRLIAARRLGYKTVPVIYVDLSPDQAHLLNLALNKISGDWDEQLLARMLADLQANAVDLSVSGFDADEINRLLKGLDAQDKRDRLETFDLEAALADTETKPITQSGDLWLLGDHRLLCGDSTNEKDIARLMEGGSADMAFTDPPYNVSYGDHGGQQPGSRRRRIQNDSLSPQAWEAFCGGWARNLLAFVHGALYICVSSREWPTVSRILQEAGAHWSDTIIWAKDRFTLGRADYQRQYEPLWYGWREGAKHHWCGDRDQGRHLDDPPPRRLCAPPHNEADGTRYARHREQQPTRGCGARSVPGI